LHKYVVNLIQDQYGNYVIQHILEKGQPKDKKRVVTKVKGQLLPLSKHKFASNVVEKCVTYSDEKDRMDILHEVIEVKADGTSALSVMMKDQFANYVVQRLLDVVHGQPRSILLERIRPHLQSLKKYTYGKHLITSMSLSLFR
jgi:hypothetical protein